MHQVFLSVGGNIGNKLQNLQKVRLYIKSRIGEIDGESSVYETPPWGFLADDDFWNQVLQVKTNLDPEELLSEIHAIEKLFNRKRDAGYYMSREMDIDILYFDDLILSTDKLIIPHPQLSRGYLCLFP